MTRRPRSALLGLLLVLSLAPAHTSADSGGGPGHDTDHEALVYRNGAACGVERWLVKTGMDSDVRRVDTAHVVGTTIDHLRSLRAPATLPAKQRVRPVETTVYALDGTLVRYKEETDSDVHLVVADANGHTMIVEIPDAVDCIGTSPFKATIARLRRAFDARFQPNKRAWQRPGLRIHVMGVGFFDFIHGQSGVAPNGIELHPVLALSWPGGGTSYTQSSAVATPRAGSTATPRPGPSATPPSGASATPAPGGLRVAVHVAPNPTADGTLTTVSATTSAGAACTVSVLYASGHTARSSSLETTQTASSTGAVSWSWTPDTKTPGQATATVTCTLGSRQGTGSAPFTVQ